MNEIRVNADVMELLCEFREVYAEIMGEDPMNLSLDDVANAVLGIGLSLMIAGFFETLDQGTLEKSLAAFFASHPDIQSPNPIPQSDNSLAAAHADLAIRHPKRFFPFMLGNLKWSQWAKARDRFKRMFDKHNS
jgi:hypothetical protein